MNLLSIIKRPIITEKSSAAQSVGKYTFLVDLKAKKLSVAHAIEAMYKTKVDAVSLIPVQPKTRLVGRGKLFTKRDAGLKAVVTLKKGLTIDVLSVKEDK